MANKTKTFLQWCTEKNEEKLLKEIDYDEYNYSKGYIPDRIPYNSDKIIYWKCEKGHKWKCELVVRTKFGLKCPICYPDNDILPVGTKYGCLTIIKNEGEELEQYEKEFEKQIFEAFGKVFHSKVYECQCKCGAFLAMNQKKFLEKQHRFCSEQCGLAKEYQEKKKERYKKNATRKYAENYDVDFTNKKFESLKVLKCIDDKFEKVTSYGDLRKNNAYTYTIFKLYKCRCYLCGKEQNIKCSDFQINPPTDYGYDAYNGYWSRAKCDCHKISSFQWIVNKLLFENNVSYLVEYSFDDLFGQNKVNKLKFDFAIFNSDGTLKCLIECQGEQHFKPVKEFGGKNQYDSQRVNDNLKREYVREHNIKLIEISYKEKKYEKVESILKENGII